MVELDSSAYRKSIAP